MNILARIKQFFSFFRDACREFYQAGWRRRNGRYVKYRRKLAVDDHMILYESFWGRAPSCNPYAMFLHLVSDPRYKDYKHVWALEDFDVCRDFIQDYTGFSNVTFVKYMSRDYLKALCRAKYLFNNTAFPPFFSKREGQVYVNTWHGIPLKKIGFDMQNGVGESKNAIRDLLQSDYMLSANPFLTQIYKDAYKLDGLYQGKIIEEGYPRLDTLVREDRAQLIARVERTGVKVDPDKKIILYAPTWRETATEAQAVIDDYAAVKKTLEDAAPEYQVLIKAHQYVFQLIQKSGLTSPDYIIPATVDANQVLPLADILISDYSSIYFDYLHFKRPILFYIPDVSAYSDYRGFYMTLDTLPGPMSEELSDIVGWVKDIDAVAARYQSALEQGNQWCCQYDVGHIAERVADVVFQGRDDSARLVSCLDGKKTLLLYLGDVRVEKVWRDALRVLTQTDLDQFDVTVSFYGHTSEKAKLFMGQLDPRVRIMAHCGAFNLTLRESVQKRFINTYGLTERGVERIYKREAKRCFGCAVFDYAIDLNGYSFDAAVITAYVSAKTKGIWLNSNMVKEQESRYPWLERVFAVYPRFDYLISNSESLLALNRDALAGDELPAERFVYLPGDLT